MRTRTILAALMALTVAAACRKTERTEITDSGVAAVMPVLAVTTIDLGRSLNADRTILDRTETFARTDTIYAAVATSGSGSGDLRSRWTFQDGQVVNESTQSISPTGPAVTEFHISKPDGWPVGRYKVEIFLNGISAGSKDFEVK
jgi:hypothetical protein